MKLNRNFERLQDNYLFAEIANRVDKYKKEFPQSDVISLGIGDVTQPLSLRVVAAGKSAADEMSTRAGVHGYAPYDGYPFLKTAIINYYARRDIEILPDDLFITDGSKDAMGNFLDLFDETCKVLVPSPVYPAYVDANEMHGRKIIYVNGTRENGFLPEPPEKIKPDIIYICSPNNPTGAAYTVEQLEKWVNYALANKAVILYDAAYEFFIEDEVSAHSIYQVRGARGCAVEFNSFSKMAGFTGVRCGWMVVPIGLQLNRMWMRRQATKYNGTSYIVQRMAEAALTTGYESIKKDLEVYKTNAKIMCKTLDRLGIEYVGGTNAPYVWFYCDIDSWEFFDTLLKNARIVATPGVGFGKDSNGWLRFSAFNQTDRTQEAMKRFEAFWMEFVRARGVVFATLSDKAK